VVNHSVRVSGIREMVITKLDVLNDFDTIKICVGYRVDGKVFQHVPSNLGVLKRSEPVYEELEGWKTELKGVRDFKDLPLKAQQYLRRIEKLIGMKIAILSVGSERSETLEVKTPFLKRSLKR
jgi:adenylosuccinate synthase